MNTNKSCSQLIKPSAPKLTALLGIPFILLILIIYAAGSGQITAAPTAAKLHEVQVVPVKLQSSYLQKSLATGRVEAGQRAALGFELSGTLAKIRFDEGEFVNQGDLLAQLDTARLDARMMELNASLARAKADARLAALSEQRIKELVAQKLESKQRLDETRESTLAAQALVTEIKAQQASLQVELDKSKLIAPFDGYILTRAQDTGTVVAAGQMIFDFQQQSDLEVRIALPAQKVSNIRQGQTTELIANRQSLQGTVKAVAKQRRLDTRTIDVIYSLPDNSDLLPGDLVSVRVFNEQNVAGAWVPTEALTGGVRGLWTIYTAQQQDQLNGKVIARSVEAIYSNEGQTFVSGALSEGDQLIVSGTQRLVPDQLVRINPQTSAIAQR